jgi:toxin YoeB
MEIVFTPTAITDLNYWKKTNNAIVQKKITSLLISIQQDPYTGIGKPEALKFNLAPKWSRRINAEHRLVYEVLNNQIIIHSLRGHYY